jgi:PAS domain S-box-containing protein
MLPEVDSEKTAAIFSNPFEGFFRKHHAVMLLIDGETGTIVDANEAALDFYGCSLQRITGMNIADINGLATEDLPAELTIAAAGRENPLRRYHRAAGGIIKHVEIDYASAFLKDKKCFFSIIRDISAYDTVEKSLVANQARYGLIFNNCNDALFVSEFKEDNTTGLFTEVNDVACERLEYTREELLHMTQLDISPAEMKNDKLRALEKLSTAGTSVFEMVHISKSGKIIPVEISSKAFMDNHKRYILSIARDISAHKKLENALRESEYFFKESQRVACIGSYSTDFVAGFWISSEILDSIFGIDKDYDRSIRGWLEIVHPDDREPMNRYLQEIIAAKHKAFEHAYRIIRKSDGTVRWVYGRGELSFGREGSVLAMIGTIQDITETKKREQRERLALDVLDLLNHKEISMDCIHEIIVRIKEFSQMEAIGIRLRDGDDYPYCETTGFPGHFLEKERCLCEPDANGCIVRDGAGNPVLECMCGNIIRGRVQASQPFFTEGGSFWTNNTTLLLAATTEEDRRARTRNRCNGEGYESVALIPIRSENAIVGLLQLNDRRPGMFTIELIKFFEDLASSIGIAIFRKQAAEDRLRFIEQSRQSQKLEALGILAGGIAHDFNNLMGGVYGYIDLARADTADEKVAQFLSKAMNTIHRARGLTRQLLTFAKGGAPLLSAGPLFPFVEDTARLILSGSNSACMVKVPANLWQCNFDENQIGQVIDNIVINAQQAMPLGGTIEIYAENVPVNGNHPFLKKGNYVKLTVKDHGIGIPAHILPSIFDPFFTTKSKGHGLGLATCFSILNRHGGSIEVESEQGLGSSFHMYLPAALDAGIPKKSAADKKHRGTGTILVVDDEGIMRETIRDMLESFGYSVLLKENGKEAIDFVTLETAEKHPLAGILFDLTIPGGIGGREAILEIRSINPDIPVFAISGYAEDPVIANPEDYGFTGSLCKPFKMADLAALLNKHVTSIPR